jgi:hypothetical protein
MVLEKDGMDQLDQWCEKLSITWSEEGKKHPTYNKQKEE